MHLKALHAWDLSPKEAMAIQRDLARRVVCESRLGAVRWIAGADMACDEKAGKVYAGVLVFRYPELVPIEEKGIVAPLRFPYVPGLLAFREAPALLEAFSKLEHSPDLVLIDGQGIAHPRGLGIASHIGLFLDCPTIGCAKSRLCGRHEEPPVHRGAWVPLMDDSGRTLGAVVRTRDGVQPVYVSIGNRIDLPTAIEFTLACCRGYRIPEPTRQADLFVARLKRQSTEPSTQTTLF